MKSPAISVLMPVYNAQAYLQPAIDSVLSQTFKDFELLLLDDGSTDESVSIIQRAATADNRVRPIMGIHTGYVPKLNEGLKLARAPLVARMDADDISLPERFERQYAFLTSNPHVMVVGTAFQNITLSGKLLDYVRHPTSPQEVASKLRSGSAIAHPTVMYRKQVILSLGGYREIMMPAEDYDLWLRVLTLYPEGLTNLSEPLLLYRTHAGQISNQKAYLQMFHTLAAQAAFKMRQDGKTDPFEENEPITYEKLSSLMPDEGALDRAVIQNYCSRIIHLHNLNTPFDQIKPLQDEMWQHAQRFKLINYTRAMLGTLTVLYSNQSKISKCCAASKALVSGVWSVHFLREVVQRILQK